METISRAQQMKQEIEALVATKQQEQQDLLQAERSDGVHDVYDQNHLLCQKITLKNGKKNGLVEYYNNKGQVMYAECFVDDVREGPAMAFNSEGQIIAKLHYTKGILEGPCDFYLKEKIICHATFVQSKIDGTMTIYDPNGNLSVKAPFVAGKKEGLLEAFDLMGHVIATAEYKADKKEGYVKNFNDQRDLTKISHYLNDVLEGDVVEYAPNGRIKQVEKYQHGKLIEAPKKY